MNTSKYIRYIFSLLVLLTLFTACEEKSEKITQQTEFALKVDESVDIILPSSTSYTVTLTQPLVDYTLSGDRLTVTALKEGNTVVKVILDSGEERKYSFTISQNSYQIGFKVSGTPRIEAWIPDQIIYTEDVDGLQVSCEPGIGITGEESNASTRSYGFVFLESGKLLRFTAQGNFSQVGTLSNGIAALRESVSTPINYEACTVRIEKVKEGKIWVVLQFKDRKDIRIVTEAF